MPPTAEETAAAEKAAAEAKEAADKVAAAEAMLGDAGKKALQAERASKKDAEKRARAAEAELAEAKAALEKAISKNQTEAEKALAQATKDAAEKAESETAAKFSRRILESEILAAAGGRLATPSDAVALLDLDDFDVDADTEELRTSIKTAIDKLIEARPYLRSGKVQGDGDGGAKPKPPSNDKLTPDQRLARGYEESST